MTIIFNTAPQGSVEWLEARRGVITASRFKDACDKLKSGEPSKAALSYAMDLARERAGGTPPPVYVNGAMRTGTEQEPLARMAYEARTGYLVEEVGFAYTEDRKFGASVDGLINDDGTWECKVMVASATLFQAVVDGDISEYRLQCVGALWLLTRKWCDLTLWCPDMPRQLHIVRIERNEAEIDKLVTDLMSFERLVNQLTAKLIVKLAEPLTIAAA